MLCFRTPARVGLKLCRSNWSHAFFGAGLRLRTFYFEGNMADYQKMYYELFNELTQVMESIDNMNYGQAKEIINYAQQRAEEIFISEEN